MSVKSIFEFRFESANAEEGLRMAEAIGNDMPPLKGYLDHEVIQDVSDPGHLMVNTHWASVEDCNAVLSTYKDDDKIKQASALLPEPPKGFVGTVRGASR